MTSDSTRNSPEFVRQLRRFLIVSGHLTECVPSLFVTRVVLGCVETWTSCGMCPQFVCTLRHIGLRRELYTLRTVSKNPFVNCGVFGCVEIGHVAESVQNRFANWDILGCAEHLRHFAECVRHQFANLRYNLSCRELGTLRTASEIHVPKNMNFYSRPRFGKCSHNICELEQIGLF